MAAEIMPLATDDGYCIPRASEFGSGSTSNYNALYVISSTVPAPDDLSFIAYPSAGFPKPLVFDRWSFSIPGADFSAAVVQMQTQSGQYPRCRRIGQWLWRQHHCLGA